MLFPPTWANLAALMTDNPILKFLIGANFIVFDFFWIPFAYMVISRIAFAQGLDQIGPRWFYELSPRFGSQTKLLAVIFVLGQVGITYYCFSPEILGSLSVTGLDAMTVWGILGISCAIFPFVKKVRHIWDASPHRWKIGPVPVATIAGIMSIVFTIAIIWGIYYSPTMGGLNLYWTPIYTGVGVFAVLWYYYWRWKRMKQGIDVTLAFKELPPE
jgi:amino acid transporter